MGELKSFSRLVMCTDIKGRLVFESLPFKYNCVEAEADPGEG